MNGTEKPSALAEHRGETLLVFIMCTTMEQIYIERERERSLDRRVYRYDMYIPTAHCTLAPIRSGSGKTIYGERG